MSLLSQLSLRLHQFLERSNARNTSLIEQQLVLQAQSIAQENRKKAKIGSLKDIEFKAFSQWGEDGIIDWLISRLPSINQTFIEFGVSDYKESNTRLLLQLRNWKGLIIDGAEENVSIIKKQDIYWRHDLTAIQSFISTENINQTISDAGFSGNVGLLSIDIDGNDYWVWQAIEGVSPAIVVCEYNAVLGDIYPITIPYQANFQRTNADPSNLYFGASIQALISLGQSKGYTFVGTTLTGANAFFIRNDCASMVTNALKAVYAFPSKFREARDTKGNLLYLNGSCRREVINNLSFVDPISGKSIDLSNVKEIYSSKWLEGKGAEF